MIKKGKTPVEKKSGEKNVAHDELFGNALTLSPELLKELDDKGLEGHFVDYKRMKEMDGYHPKGWKIYQRPKSDTMDNQEFKLGSAPDGIIRRGSTVLAVKTKEQAEKHRRYLDQKAKRQRAAYQKQAAQELRQAARDNRLDSRIIEGYEENE